MDHGSRGHKAGSEQVEGRGIMHGPRRPRPAVTRLAIVVAAVVAGAAGPPNPANDLTFRPTVLIRKGQGQGSGTIIASVDGATLILTAAHVVEGKGTLLVELHRYNLGLERSRPSAGWPRSVAAEVLASEPDADLAVVRVRKMVALPYVARIASEAVPLTRGTIVTSIGLEGGETFQGWPTRVGKLDRFTIEGSEAERSFVLTADPPDHGRSGGGLFLENGDLDGVCVGRSAHLVKGRLTGVFASPESIGRLLRDHDLHALVARPASAPRHAPITPTRARLGAVP